MHTQNFLFGYPKFIQDIQSKVGKKIDVSDIDEEIRNFQKRIVSLERSKSRLEQDIDNVLRKIKVQNANVET